jgi:DNA-binding transcriptional LysR family regulator
MSTSDTAKARNVRRDPRAHADRILAAVQEAGSAVAAVKGTVGATATLAALPSSVAKTVAPALTALGSRHPQLTVTCLVTAVIAALRTAARQGRTTHLPAG